MIGRNMILAMLLPPVVALTSYGSISHIPSTTLFTSTSLNMVHNTREADPMERWAGGERYEMVPLPDSMVDQTVFVGNLCEFVQDDDLSRMFQRVSHLQSVPACVARRANKDSLEYGFVAFPTVEEKEVRLLS
jgi:hypothetical protein